MRTRIQRWGNSLALRIPKSVAVDAGLASDSVVDVTLVDGKVVVTPLSGERFTLDQLLSGVTDDNRHGENATGPAVGQEVW
jgi:antitoxin MazE